MSSDRIRQLLKSNKSRRPYLTDMDMPGFTQGYIPSEEMKKLPSNLQNKKPAPKRQPMRGDFPDKGKVR